MDAEICEVVVTLTNEYAERTQEAIDAMAKLGFTAGEIIEDEGVVNGTIDGTNLKALEELEPVSHVRTTLRYWANYPPGDPRDRDGRSASGPRDAR